MGAKSLFQSNLYVDELLTGPTSKTPPGEGMLAGKRHANRCIREGWALQVTSTLCVEDYVWMLSTTGHPHPCSSYCGEQLTFQTCSDTGVHESFLSFAGPFPPALGSLPWLSSFPFCFVQQSAQSAQDVSYAMASGIASGFNNQSLIGSVTDCKRTTCTCSC